MNRLFSTLRRVPFTLIMLLGIASIGFLTGTNAGAIAPVLLKRWGFALHDLWQGTWYSLFTGVLFTLHPFMFWGILGFVVCSIGVYEWRAGTRLAFLLYWLTDTGGNLLLAVGFVLPLFLLRTQLGISLAFDDDVGMSGGGFGSVGGWVHRLPTIWRSWVAGGVMTYLILHLMIVNDFSADVLHLMTFPLGFWLEERLTRMTK